MHVCVGVCVHWLLLFQLCLAHRLVVFGCRQESMVEALRRQLEEAREAEKSAKMELEVSPQETLCWLYHRALSLSLSLSICYLPNVHIYIYIYIERERER